MSYSPCKVNLRKKKKRRAVDLQLHLFASVLLVNCTTWIRLDTNQRLDSHQRYPSELGIPFKAKTTPR